ncbi:hypothetical protein H5410_045619 [Solanum commersonii]|uniref:Uncharacterized protein n=1 Tax=Solanum commersonii TaxID=4109 RepID=A0A9J5XA13_SOLCO|nr:hypothetical protein H5410_045619 [Solanum commersonii]
MHIYSFHDYIWRGIIAKNGTSVCHALCVPIGESIESEMEVPEFKDRVGVAKLNDGTNMFLVPPLDFIRKLLIVDGLACIYDFVIKSAPHTPSVTSVPPESYQPRYMTLLQVSNFQQSSSGEGIAGASADMTTSDVTVLP